LKSGVVKKTANSAVKVFSETLLPAYAIKEFKAGPLNNFVWMHNKLAMSGSFTQGLSALRAMSATPRRHTTSTAIQALEEASSVTLSKSIDEKLSEKYSQRASWDNCLADEFRLEIKKRILLAWKKRRKVTTVVVGSARVVSSSGVLTTLAAVSRPALRSAASAVVTLAQRVFCTSTAPAITSKRERAGHQPCVE